MFEFNIYTWLIIIFTLVIVGITGFLRYIGRNDDYWKIRGVKYHPRQSLFKILKVLSTSTFPELVKTGYHEYGRVYGTFSFSQPAITISDPKLLRDIFVKDFNYFSHRQDQAFNDKILDTMISVLNGEDWKRIRTIISPAFTSKQMRKMENIINGCSKTVLKTFEKYYKNGEPVDCKAIFGAFVTDAIALSAFATKVDSLNNPDHIFVKMIKECNQAFDIKRVIFLSLIPRRLQAYFRLGALKPMDFFKKVVVETIKERREKGVRYDDFLQSLMDAVEEQKPEVKKTDTKEEEDVHDQYGSVTNTQMPKQLKYKWLSEDELVAQCILFYFVGYETTASTIAYMAYALATNQQWQDKLIAEVDEAFKKHGEVGYDAVRDMKLMDAVVSETLRMYPPGLMTARITTSDYKLGDTGIVLEKGIPVLIPLYAMHYDVEFFPEPETFNPERFMDSSKVKHPQYTYLPFGEGPRNCLGMRFALLEIKLCMANILHHYKFRTHSTTKVPLEYKKYSVFLSVTELPLALEKINPSADSTL
ncbi:cytochrome P450 3A9 [Parasteatoda tepidariorum]|uniref:cytochrome P450 3A9 n=1 Tax=Parasteatoda tepidariorum TaxID=114398 RepID=UPI0039BC4174